ncbi:MAG TPA: hypothetical protein VL092_02595 [Chitinophagaceae bacterium]|nr:hypothetical protein [Chitinophagaceae bacterium]
MIRSKFSAFVGMRRSPRGAYQQTVLPHPLSSRYGGTGPPRRKGTHDTSPNAVILNAAQRNEGSIRYPTQSLI